MNIQDVLMELYKDATIVSKQSSQVVGNRNDNYITLEQLMNLMEKYVK